MREFEKDAVVALLVRMNEAARVWTVYSRLATRVSEGRETAMKEYHAATTALKEIYHLDREAENFVETAEKVIGADNLKRSVDLTRSQMESAENIIDLLMDYIAESFGVEPSLEQKVVEDADQASGLSMEEAKSESNIKDRVLAALQDAGPKGTTASRIRDILRTEGLEMHDKTVGMNLWRLSTEDPPKARREGRTWFYAIPDITEGDPGEGPTQNDIFN